MACNRDKVSVAFTVIGVIAGLSAFVVFSIYGNIRAATWAFISSVFASICLHLYWLQVYDKLADYHSPQTLSSLKSFGLFVFLLSCAFTCWYFFCVFYWPKSHDLASSSVITAVWSAMTAKWSLCVALSAKRFSRILWRECSPLLPS